jgi:hypothetical protein
VDTELGVGIRYGLDFGEPLDWAVLIDRAVATGCVDEMLDLQSLVEIEEADEWLRRLAAGASPPADFPALLRAALAAERRSR